MMVFVRDRERWTDAQLIVAIAGCDDRAFSAFYRRHLDLTRVLEFADDQGSSRRLLAELPPDERAAVRARVIDERPYGEIARSLGCSEMVVRKRVSRGLARLRAGLATR